MKTLEEYYIQAEEIKKTLKFVVNTVDLVNQLIEIDKGNKLQSIREELEESLRDINNAIVGFRDNELRELMGKL